MNATVHAPGRASLARLPSPRNAHTALAPARVALTEQPWLVDVGALADCRALLSGHEPAGEGPRLGQQALLDVPAPYEQFCRSHFASVQRLHPEISWEDACPAYAVALSAHALLCDALDAGRERLLADNWSRIRGQSSLDWRQAGTLIADGCSALARLDPLAMRR